MRRCQRPSGLSAAEAEGSAEGREGRYSSLQSAGYEPGTAKVLLHGQQEGRG